MILSKIDHETDPVLCERPWSQSHMVITEMLASYRIQTTEQDQGVEFYRQFLSVHKHTVRTFYCEKPKMMYNVIIEDPELDDHYAQGQPANTNRKHCLNQLKKTT